MDWTYLDRGSYLGSSPGRHRRGGPDLDPYREVALAWAPVQLDPATCPGEPCLVRGWDLALNWAYRAYRQDLRDRDLRD